MTAAAYEELHSFRIAHPVIRTSSRAEVTAVAALATLAMILWLIVVPLELALRVSV